VQIFFPFEAHYVDIGLAQESTDEFGKEEAKRVYEKLIA
jgi:hypothetical protein